jgi:lipoprotein-anchoring transpeptidase ErfK/SrfK
MAKHIEVSLATQTLRAFDSHKLIYTFDCITGDADHPTDQGSFPLWKDATHVSHKYHVKMYYAMFFTKDGKAIHQYHGPFFELTRSLKEGVSDWFGSHGCVRLEEEHAKALFEWAPAHTIVFIK